MRNVFRILINKPEEKRPHGRPTHRRRCENNIKMDLRKLRCKDVDWIQQAQDSIQWRDFCECGSEPSGSIKGEELLNQLSAYNFLYIYIYIKKKRERERETLFHGVNCTPHYQKQTESTAFI
jgi:hypothetical protein